jgi:hypothetical protein
MLDHPHIQHPGDTLIGHTNRLLSEVVFELHVDRSQDNTMICSDIKEATTTTMFSHALVLESALKAQPSGSKVLEQLDGPSEYYREGRPSNTLNVFAQPTLLARAQPHHQHRMQQHQANRQIASQVVPQQQTHAPKNAVTDILPYCTTEAPLRQDQVIALSDVVGSIKELVLLALGAAVGDIESLYKMEGAVGPETTRSIVEFFAEEWEIE